MINIFYNIIKAVLTDKFPQQPQGEGVRLIDYDYGQYLPRSDGKLDKPNFPKLAIYIGVEPFFPRSLYNKELQVDEFRFSITLVQHTAALDNDKRIEDEGLNHWNWISQINEFLNGKQLLASDSLVTGIAPNSPQNYALTGLIALTGVTPESRLSTQIITRINYQTSLCIKPISPAQGQIVTPDINVNVETFP